MDASPAARIDPRDLRDVLGTFVTGVTVITTLDAAGQPHGLTANSFNSVSLDPPLVLWSQALAARSHPVFRDARHFAVNILAEDQVEVAARFARAGGDKFGPTPMRRGGLHGLPLVEGCAAWLECERHAAHEAGDHVIYIGRVLRMERAARRPLAFGGGRYLLAHAHDFAPVTSDEASANRRRLRAARLAAHAAVELADTTRQAVGVVVWGSFGPTVIHWELPPRPVNLELRLGAVLPPLESAAGLAFFAWLPPHETAWVLEGPVGGELQAELAWVRTQGLVRRSRSVDAEGRGEVQVHALSAPVFDAGGHMLLALTVLADDEAATDPAGPVAQALLACTRELGRRIPAIG